MKRLPPRNLRRTQCYTCSTRLAKKTTSTKSTCLTATTSLSSISRRIKHLRPSVYSSATASALFASQSGKERTLKTALRETEKTFLMSSPSSVGWSQLDASVICHVTFSNSARVRQVPQRNSPSSWRVWWCSGAKIKYSRISECTPRISRTHAWCLAVVKNLIKREIC